MTVAEAAARIAAVPWVDKWVGIVKEHDESTEEKEAFIQIGEKNTKKKNNSENCEVTSFGGLCAC